MLHSVFELHQEAIRWVNSMICYVEHQAAPSGCLYAFIDLRHLGCDRQVAEYDSPTLSEGLVAAASHCLVHNAPAHSRGEEADSEMCSSTPAAAWCCARTLSPVVLFQSLCSLLKILNRKIKQQS